jgi:DNA-binding FrmR family transcriptional regulator
MSQIKNKENIKILQNRLARVEGQIRGINKLLENEADCKAVAQQMAAARKALDKAFFAMVGCMIEQGDTPPEKISELLVKLA